MKKAVSFFAAMSAAVVMATAALPAFFTVSADAPFGYVTMSVEKFSVGEGYLVEPTKVPFYEGETGLELTERLIGKENINNGDGVGAYLQSIADPNGGEGTVPAAIEAAVTASGKTISTDRSTSGWLGAYDYTPLGGWMYLLNNESAAFGIADYTPVEGDVVRWSFSMYGFGADLGLDTSSMAEWGGAAPCVPVANRDALNALLASVKADGLTKSEDAKAPYEAALQTAADVNSDQAALDGAYAALQSAYLLAKQNAVTTMATTTTTAQTTTGQTTTTLATTTTQSVTSITSEPAPKTGDASGIWALFGVGTLAAAFVSCKRKYHA